MDSDKALSQIIKTHGLRLTKPRQLVFEFLYHSRKPVEMSQIVALAGNWADRASLYRTVKLFKELGIIKEVHRPGKDLLELGEAFSNHHHHFSCSRCELSLSIASSKLERTIAELARQANFAPQGHHLEITGLCPDCSTSGN